MRTIILNVLTTLGLVVATLAPAAAGQRDYDLSSSRLSIQDSTATYAMSFATTSAIRNPLTNAFRFILVNGQITPQRKQCLTACADAYTICANKIQLAWPSDQIDRAVDICRSQHNKCLSCAE